MWLLFLVVCTIQGILSSKGLGPPKGSVNPEAYMNISEIIRLRGYQAEEYEVVTPDGYILSINRIPCGQRKPSDVYRKPVVLLQHGFVLEGSNWITNMRNNSLGFMLADAGFDEMARYDLPAIISFIVEKTRIPKIHFVGFSQGATQGFIAFSSMPHVAENIRMFHALAPLSTLKNSPSPFVKLLFLPDKIIKSRIDVYMSHFPDSTSVQNLLHWGQIYKTGKFRAFDYGSGNQDKYNQTEPPSYDLESMRVPTTVWYGEKDWFADPDNVKALMCRIRSIVYENSLSNWTHFDFLWGLDAPDRLYKPLIELINFHP
ncbi:hypothetical protein JD844_006494 [Phrynosoma platyrhinos]|uniref:Uncharacterized protein n=1 Tax=Phrynosoma platyrhinos TaxID=52577 RepID=A0ABQ7T1W1_PHRPL|nr:hypothetical protein JD844_006494 [Phrynosoma platyrhinos]